VPNVITPNGDRINDYFYVKSTDIETFTISIRDRNGNEIFSSNDKEFNWDGTNYSGDLVEKGMYTYLIIAQGKDGSVIKLPGQIYVQ
jgi:gliding motility-associated-like protein